MSLPECFTDSNTKWYLYSGCSKRLTGDKTLFSTFIPKEGGFIFYLDNNKGTILGFGTIGKSLNPTIEEVLLVKGLKQNLLSINKLCDKGNNVIFNSSGCRVIKSKSNETQFK